MDGLKLGAADALVYGVVNIVNVAIAVLFVSRVMNSKIAVVAGLVAISMALPLAVAIALYVVEHRHWFHLVGPSLYIAFAIFALVVDHILKIEFRHPANLGIAVPFVVLVYASIFAMGVVMYPISKPLWSVTAVTAILNVAAMTYAQMKGVG